MDYIRSLFTGKKHAPVASNPGEIVRAPYLGDMNDVRVMPMPASGMERAAWFANSIFPEDQTLNAASIGIGSKQRGVNGPVRGGEWGDDFYAGYIEVSYPDRKTQESDNLGPYWLYQTQQSSGLNVPGNDQVYVNKDTQSIWT
jgi:hypothetical protein